MVRAALFLARRARGGQAGGFVFHHRIKVFYSHADRQPLSRVSHSRPGTDPASGPSISASSITPRSPKTGITGSLPEKRFLSREPLFLLIRNMPHSSERASPGSGRFPPRYSVTGRFGGNSPIPGSMPDFPEDRSFREKTDGNRSGSPPSFSPFDMTRRHTPRSFSSGRRSSRWGFWLLRPILRTPAPPHFTSRSRRESGTSPSPRTMGKPSLKRKTRSPGSGCLRKRNSGAKPLDSTGVW